MDEDDISSIPGAQPTQQDQLTQYALLGAYFITIYLFSYLICRLIQWQRSGRLAGLYQGLLLIGAATALFMLWGLRLCQGEEGTDLIKACGLGFMTLFISIGGAFHGEHSRLRKQRKLAGTQLPEEEEAVVATDELPPAEA